MEDDGETKIDATVYEALANEAASEIFPDYDPAAMGVVFNLIRVANRIVKDLENSVHRQAGLTFAAYRLLFTVRSVGPVSPSRLAQLSGVSTASISSLLGTLTREGLVTRSLDPAHGRRKIVRLSSLGAERLRDSVRDNSLRETAWASALTDAEAAIFAELLRKLLVHKPAPKL
jgi:DNA-binding MarR family transcriptional regulator